MITYRSAVHPQMRALQTQPVRGLLAEFMPVRQFVSEPHQDAI